MRKGYIKLSRNILEHWLWIDSGKFDRRSAWIDMLLKARWGPKQLKIRGVDITLERSQLAWSKKRLAREWGWNERTVSIFLKELENDDMIQCKITNVTTIITVCNWSKWNKSEAQNTTQNTAQNTNEIRKSKKEKEKNIYKKRNFSVDGFEPEIIEFVTRYYDSRYKVRPLHMKRWETQRNKTLYDGCVAVKNMCLPVTEVRKILAWAVKDEFWGTLVDSLPGLHKNGDKKLLTIKDRMSKDKEVFIPTKPQKTYYLICPVCEYSGNHGLGYECQKCGKPLITLQEFRKLQAEKTKDREFFDEKN